MKNNKKKKENRREKCSTGPLMTNGNQCSYVLLYKQKAEKKILFKRFTSSNFDLVGVTGTDVPFYY